MPQMTLQQAFELAFQHHQAGRFHEAEQIYRAILSQEPGHADALHFLGVLAYQQGQLAAAVDLIRQAISRKPNFPEACYHLANALKDMGQLDEAIATYRQTIILKPDFPEAYISLSSALKDTGQLDEAIAACRRAITLRPDYPAALYNLGTALSAKGRFDEAVVAYRRAIACKPDFPEAYSNLGNALRDFGDLNGAIAACWQAIALKPDLAEAHCNLANAMSGKGQLDEAIAAYRQALNLKPDYPEAHCNLGSALKDKGNLDGAIASYRRAVAFQPNFGLAHSNLLLALHYHLDSTPQSLLEESQRWAAQHAEPLRHLIRPHTNDRNPNRRIRLGYVSPDLVAGVITKALLPLMASHDHQAFEIFCYAQVPVPDAMTRRLAGTVDVWRTIVGLSDAQVADLIRRDQIDVLVDLSGHTNNNRLLVFARKPAPVQVEWLGYPGTTGMRAMDYRITTAVLDPPDVSDAFYTERSYRLPETAGCYEPGDQTPEVVPPPALTTGRITFGCLNNLCKITAPVLTAWIQVLRAVPNSDLLVYALEGDHRQRLRDLLAREGIAADRVRFVGWGGAKYFDFYREMDITLGPWPYTGSTTTCDSLWMGVPVVSRDGILAVSRLSSAVLSNLGLSAWVAHTTEEYVRIATDLAGDLPRLAHLRSTLRQRMRESPLMNAPRFARNMEIAYRQMWQDWCLAVP